MTCLNPEWLSRSRGPNGATRFHLSLERSSSLSCEGNWTCWDTGADASTYVSLAGGDSLSRPLPLHPPCHSGCDVIGQPTPPLNWARRGQCSGTGPEAPPAGGTKDYTSLSKKGASRGTAGDCSRAVVTERKQTAATTTRWLTAVVVTVGPEVPPSARTEHLVRH